LKGLGTGETSEFVRLVTQLRFEAFSLMKEKDFDRFLVLRGIPVQLMQMLENGNAEKEEDKSECSKLIKRINATAATVIGFYRKNELKDISEQIAFINVKRSIDTLSIEVKSGVDQIQTLLQKAEDAQKLVTQNQEKTQGFLK